MRKPRRRYVQRIPPTPPGAEIPGQRELLAVREIAHAFLQADRAEEAFQFALDRVGPVVGASFASVYIVDGASELMRLVAAHNWPEQHRPWLADVRVRVGFGPSGEAASERRVIEVPDVFADPDLEDWQDVARELGFSALVSLPLQSGNAVTGAVTFYFRTWGQFTTERRGLLRLVADLMAGAADTAQLLERVRRAEAATAEALADLDRQYMAVAGLRRAQRELVESASAAIVPVLDDLEGSHAGVGDARRTVGDLLLLADLADGRVEPVVTAFDPHMPLHDAMRSVRRFDPRANLVVEEPTHELPTLKSDVEKVGITLARLLARASRSMPGIEVRVSVFSTPTLVHYHVPGREGGDLDWRVAAALTALLGGSLDSEISERGPTVVLSIPTAQEDR